MTVRAPSDSVLSAGVTWGPGSAYSPLNRMRSAIPVGERRRHVGALSRC